MKLRHKLLLGLLPVALVTSLLVGAGAFLLIRAAVESRYVDRLRAESALIATWLAGPADSPGPAESPVSSDTLQAWTRNWAQLLEVRVSLIDKEGQLVADSEHTLGEIERMDNHRDRPEIRLARTQDYGKNLRLSERTGERYYYLARRVQPLNPRSRVATVRLALPEEQVRATQSSYLLSAIALSLISMLVLVALSYTGARLLTRPIESIALAADSVSKGALDREVPGANTQELDRLSSSISHMRDTLLGKIGELQDRQALFDSVVCGMRGGVLVIDAKGRIRLANPAMRPILRIDTDPVGQLLAETVRNRELADLVAGTLLDQVERSERIGGPGNDERHFDAHVAPLALHNGEDSAGVLVLLYDITRIEALEELRKEFVADISHELRTPLTSIQAAATTLLEGALDDVEVRERFLHTITRQAERMAALLGDLTTLSSIETGAITLSLEQIDDIAPVIEDIVAQLAPRYAQQELIISIDIESPLALTVDPLRFEQIMINLLDNAMKFNRVGGFVRVTGEGYMLRIEDEGPGISAENLTRVFQRFFRLDPARSGKRGGTGLGLAIVKHLMTLHGASIRVESELGRGSVFILDFS